MSVKLTPSGDWEFSTPAEAAEFQRLQKGRGTPVVAEASGQERAPRARRRGRPPNKVARGTGRRAARAPLASKSGDSLSAGTRQILESIRRHPNGLQSEDFARAIGTTTTGIPVRMMMLGKELKALGFKPEEVVKRERIYVKGRARSVFKPGPRLDEALRRTGDLFAVAK